MHRWITGAKLIVLGLFILTTAGVAAYDVIYLWPIQECDRAGAWWDPKDHQCLTPIPIWRITNRGLASGPPGPSADPAQRVAPGDQSTSPSSLALAKRAATNSRSESRFK